MTEKAITFDREMVRAILSGQKTQIRRVVRPQPQKNGGKGLHPVEPYRTTLGTWTWVLKGTGMGDGTSGSPCPYGQPGDRLWVREAWYYDKQPSNFFKDKFDPDAMYYRADGECCQQIPECACAEVGKPEWRHPIYMPRHASRITLEVTDIRVQRLQEITPEDVYAEGAPTEKVRDWNGDDDGNGEYFLRPDWCEEWFSRLWDFTNVDRDRWAENPWVWVIEFRIAKAVREAAR